MRSLFTSPSTILTLVLFIISSGLALYSREIRQFLSLPPHKLLHLWKALRLASYQFRLSRAKLFHNDIGGMLALFMFYGGMASTGTILTIVLSGAQQAAQHHSSVLRMVLAACYGLATGGAFGASVGLLRAGRDLMLYPLTVERLEAKISKLTDSQSGA